MGSPCCVTALLQGGGPADANATTDHGATALVLAAGNGHAECMQRLLMFGADPTIADGDGNTPLSIAKRNRDDEVRSQPGRASVLTGPGGGGRGGGGRGLCPDEHLGLNQDRTRSFRG